VNNELKVMLKEVSSISFYVLSNRLSGGAQKRSHSESCFWVLIQRPTWLQVTAQMFST